MTGTLAWLNRAGILFNVVAGFLLAPQLIPKGWIAEAEEWAKQHMDAATERQRQRTAKIRARGSAGLPYKRQIVEALIWIAIAAVGIVMSGAYDQLWGASAAVTVGVAMGLAIMVLVAAVGTMLIAAVAAWKLVNAVLGWALTIAQRHSEARVLVKGGLTAAGIFLFVAGNALQLAATFG